LIGTVSSTSAAALRPFCKAPVTTFDIDTLINNIGFFASSGEGRGWTTCGEAGDVRRHFGHSRDQYVLYGPTYDDARTRRALANIRDDWQGTSYCLTGRNCQNFADALRVEYQRLVEAEKPRPPIFPNRILNGKSLPR
jgi:hypothetical protein